MAGDLTPVVPNLRFRAPQRGQRINQTGQRAKAGKKESFTSVLLDFFLIFVVVFLKYGTVVFLEIISSSSSGYKHDRLMHLFAILTDLRWAGLHLAHCEVTHF